MDGGGGRGSEACYCQERRQELECRYVTFDSCKHSFVKSPKYFIMYMYVTLITTSPPPPHLLPTSSSSLSCSSFFLFPLSPSPHYSSLPALPPNLISSLCIVATIVGGNRTPQQCLHRWKNSLHPGIKKGRWSPEEDEVCFVKFHSR